MSKIPETHMLEEKNQLQEVILWDPHVTVAQAHPSPSPQAHNT